MDNPDINVAALTLKTMDVVSERLLDNFTDPLFYDYVVKFLKNIGCMLLSKLFGRTLELRISTIAISR